MDAASLRNGLRFKLDHLEAKLEWHRQDLLAEFHKHYDELTRTAGPSVVASIQDELRAMLDDYKELRPSIPQQQEQEHHHHQHPPPTPPQPAAAPPKEAESPLPRPQPVSDNSPEPAATTSQTLSLASTPADAGTSSGAPDSPRDRDHELYGLFTPSYLPLLAASPTPAANTPASPAATTKAAAAAAITSQPSSVAAGSPSNAETRWLPAMTTTSDGDGNGDGDGTTRTTTTMDQSAEEDRFPGRLSTPPRHQPSEHESADAAGADDANSSASDDKSDNKPPRSALRRSSSTYKSPQSPRRVRFEFMGAEVLPTASPQPNDSMMPRSSSPMWEGENVSVDSVLGGDTEDLGPPPKKISSSDALRALSREPLEDDTVWTVVNPDSDNVTKKMQQVGLNESLATPESRIQQSQQEPSNEVEEVKNDALGIRKTRAAAPPPISKPPVIVGTGLSKNKAPLDGPDVHDDDDDMFQFEDEGGRTSSLQRLPQPTDDGEHSEDETLSSASARDLSMLRSPTTVAPAAVPSAKQSAPEAAATTPTTPRFHIGSVGSYKGRSIMMPVVKSPEVHAKAASIGNFSSFVGGVDGTSGMDPADLSSYRASVMRDGFTGTPRSFTERLMMEDMEAERLKEKANEE